MITTAEKEGADGYEGAAHEKKPAEAAEASAGTVIT